MIDAKELQEIRARAAEFAEWDEVLAIQAPGGLFSDGYGLTLEAAAPAAIASARDVPRLADLVERLSPAAYIVGPEGCAGDPECEEYHDEDGNPLLPEGQWCSHVEERVATFADVKRAEFLDDLAQRLKRAAEVALRGGVEDEAMAQIVIDAIDVTYEQIAQFEQTGEG